MTLTRSESKALRAALRAYRLAHGWSYADLADDLVDVLGRSRKLSMWTLRNFVNGTGEPQETTTHAILEYLRKKEAA